MDEKKEDFNDSKETKPKSADCESPYSLTLSVTQNKLDMHLFDNTTKYMYKNSFTTQQLIEEDLVNGKHKI